MGFCLRSQFVTTIALGLSLFCTNCQGQQVYTLSDTTIRHQLDSHVKIFVDTDGLFTFNDIMKSTIQDQFLPGSGNLTFGYLKSPLWLKVETRTHALKSRWILEIPAPFLEYVDFYQPDSDNQTWQVSYMGYYRAYNDKVIRHTGYALPLQFAGDSTSTVYIRITGASPKTFPLYVMNEHVFYEKVRAEDVGYGIFFGILIVMFFYNLLLYITLKQINYLLYVCTIVCTFLIFAAASGYAGKFLWPGHPWMNFYAGRMMLPVLVVFLSVFTIRFLEVRAYSVIMYKVLLSLIFLAIVAAILVATGLLSSAGNNLVSVSTIVYLATGIVCRINGNKTATYFIAAWTIYLTGGLLLSLRNSGALNYNFWTTHFVEIGAAMETTIIAFALGDRYRRYRQEKEEVQLLALQVQQEATEKLELKVKERTEQLSKANEELQAMLETNRLQTKIIENKNTELDAFFYRISHDLKGPVRSLSGLTSLAKKEVADKPALVYIEKVHQQAERLSAIITGLINLTRLSHTDLQKEQIDFNQMIDDCIISFNGVANFNKINFMKDVQPGVKFYSEWTLLNTILQNLIENAIKYARRHSPYVHIRIWDENGWIIIQVEDNGEGIHEEHQPRIFEMFYRATEQAGGSGLGLYILKRSVDRLNGLIDIQSMVGVGSTFTVKLPGLVTAE